MGLLASWTAAHGSEKASQFVLEDLDGQTFSLQEELKKGVHVFDFWATWCKPCIKSLPKMQALARDYQKRGVRVYTINIDGPRNQAKIRPFLKRYRLQLPVLIDKTNQVMKQFHFIAPPAALIVTPEGEVAYKHQGFKSGDEKKWRKVLDGLVGGAEEKGEAE